LDVTNTKLVCATLLMLYSRDAQFIYECDLLYPFHICFTLNKGHYSNISTD